MGVRSVEVDLYIASAPAFAQPILRHLRERIHGICPEVVETIKWSRPIFTDGGRMFCGMAAFSRHCGFGFWGVASSAVPEAQNRADEGSGQFGKLTSLADLPPDAELDRLMRQALAILRGPKAATKSPRVTRPPPETPEFLRQALAVNPAAAATFETFAPSHRREYIEWLTEAKTEATRQRRLASALEWLSAGKSRHWKYEAD
jgi:hypothetical protein